MRFKTELLLIKDSGEDTTYIRDSRNVLIAAISDGVGTTLKAKLASKSVISLVKKLRDASKETIHSKLLSLYESLSMKKKGNLFATLSLVWITPEGGFAYLIGDGVLYVNRELYHYDTNGYTSYFPNDHKIYTLPSKLQSLIICSDGISKYVDTSEELCIVMDYLLENSLTKNDFTKKLRQYPIDDISVIKIVRK